MNRELLVRSIVLTVLLAYAAIKPLNLLKEKHKSHHQLVRFTPLVSIRLVPLSIRLRDSRDRSKSFNTLNTGQSHSMLFPLGCSPNSRL